MSVNKLARWNGLSKRGVLRPGKRLVIWRGAAPAPSAKSSVTKVATQETRVVPAGATVHVVRRGDNLWTIARSYQLSSRNLAAWNRIDSDALLQPGQTLSLAPAESVASEPTKAEVRPGKDSGSI